MTTASLFDGRFRVGARVGAFFQGHDLVLDQGVVITPFPTPPPSWLPSLLSSGLTTSYYHNYLANPPFVVEDLSWSSAALLDKIPFKTGEIPLPLIERIIQIVSNALHLIHAR
jgi:hypothetical protein